MLRVKIFFTNSDIIFLMSGFQYYYPNFLSYVLSDIGNALDGTYAGSYEPVVLYTSSSGSGFITNSLPYPIINLSTNGSTNYGLLANSEIYSFSRGQGSYSSFLPSGKAWSAMKYDGQNFLAVAPDYGLYNNGTQEINDSLYLLDVEGSQFTTVSKDNWYVGNTSPFSVSTSGSFQSGMLSRYVNGSGYAAGFSPWSFGSGVTFVGAGPNGTVLTLENNNSIVTWNPPNIVLSITGLSFSSSAYCSPVNTTQFAIIDPTNQNIQFINSPAATISISGLANVGYAVSNDGLVVLVASGADIIPVSIYNQTAWTELSPFSYTSNISALNYSGQYAFWSAGQELYLYQYNGVGNYELVWQVALSFVPSALSMDQNNNVVASSGINLAVVNLAGNITLQTTLANSLSGLTFIWAQTFLGQSGNQFCFVSQNDGIIRESPLFYGVNFSGAQTISSGGNSYITLGNTSANPYFYNDTIYLTNGSVIPFEVGSQDTILPAKAGWISSLGSWTNFLGYQSGLPTAIFPYNSEIIVMFNNGNIANYNVNGSFAGFYPSGNFIYGSVFTSNGAFPTMAGTFNGIVVFPAFGVGQSYPLTVAGSPLLFNGNTVNFSVPINIGGVG